MDNIKMAFGRDGRKGHESVAQEDVHGENKGLL